MGQPAWQCVASSDSVCANQAYDQHLTCFVSGVIHILSITKTDNDWGQSFHMQSQCHMVGVKQYDKYKITNAEVKERTKLLDLYSLIAERCHWIFSHITYGNMPAWQTSVYWCLHWYTSCCWLKTFTGSSTENLAPTGGRRHQFIYQCLVSLQAWTACCEDRYDPQPVKHSSDWITWFQ